jgi:hypothetical protein
MEPVEKGVNGAAEQFTIIGYCPDVENVRDSTRLSFVPCPSVPEKNITGLTFEKLDLTG